MDAISNPLTMIEYIEIIHMRGGKNPVHRSITQFFGRKRNKYTYSRWCGGQNNSQHTLKMKPLEIYIYINESVHMHEREKEKDSEV